MSRARVAVGSSQSGNIGVSLEIDERPALPFLERQVHDSLDEPLAIAIRHRRLTPATVSFCSFAGALKNRLYQHSLHDLCGGFYFLIRSA
jgi:hypothetical protein